MEQFMTSEEVAELLHVDPVTIRRLVSKGELSAYRIGADYRFAPSDLQDYLQRQRVTAHAQNDADTGRNNPLDQLALLFHKIIKGKYITPSELVDRFDRFTERASHVMTLAQEEAEHFQHNYIGTEHLLLGLLREEEGVAARVLNNLGIEVERVRQAIEAIIGRGGHTVSGEEIVLTPRTKRVIELAVDEARRLNHRFLGTEHLLLGLIREGEGIAANILKSFGLQLAQVRAETLQILRQLQQEEAPSGATPPAEDEPGLTCASCGTRCPASFRFCFNCGQALTPEDKASYDDGKEE